MVHNEDAENSVTTSLADYDNDGDMDMLVVNVNEFITNEARVKLYRSRDRHPMLPVKRMRYSYAMLVELGHFALILAFGIAIVQMIVPMVGAHRGNTAWMSLAEPAATVQFLLTGFAFAVLTWAFVTSDFSLQLVYLNSHTDKPMIYKITGVWGNHEGSMLLWMLILTLFGALAAWFGRRIFCVCDLHGKSVLTVRGATAKRARS